MKAIIFDMDGVISDTERLHGIAESTVMRKYGINMSPQAMTDRFAGIPETDVWQTLFREHKKEIPANDILRTEKFKILTKLAAGNVQEIPGSTTLIRTLKAGGIPLAIASSSLPAFITIVTKALAIDDLFDVVTSGVEVSHGKPAPDIFLLAAEKLKIEPRSCIVIEDAKSGTQAAKAAGMRCIGYLPKHSKQDLSKADVIVDDLRKISWEMLGFSTP